MCKSLKWTSLILIVMLLMPSFAFAEGICQHEYEEIVLKAATCTDNGIIMQQCALCGDRMYEATEPSHTYNSEPDVIVPPACDEDGGNVWYCIVCNAQKDPEADGVKCETTPAAHSFNDEVTYVRATCEEDAKFVHACSVCGAEEVLQLDDTAKAFGHDWQYQHIGATCVEAEKYQIACSVCGTIRWKTDSVLSAPTGHVKPEEVTVLSAADCEKAEMIAWDCIQCSEHIEEENGAALGHTVEVSVVKEATCTEEGTANRICTVCNAVIEENVVLPVVEACEAYEIVIAPETCTENGILEYRCKWCDEHLYFASIPYGHKAGEVETVTEPACTKAGAGQVSCTVCGELLQKFSLPAKGHVYTQSPTLKTVDCTNESYAVIPCDVCGEEMICAEDEEKEIPVHTRAYRYIAPDCEKCGVLEVYCAECDEILMTIEVTDDAAIGHVYGEEKTVVQAPDCENAGSSAWICLRCSAQHDEAEIPALGHVLEMVTEKEATCLEEGVANRVCTVCAKVIEEDIILEKKNACEAKLEVLIAASCEQDGLGQYVCKWCDLAMGYTILPAGHVAGEAVVVKEATCTEEGLEQIACAHCNEVLSETVLPVAEHTYGEEAAMETPATCTEPASKHFNCLICGNEEAVKVMAVGESLGHNWSAEEKQLPADCVTPGRTVKVCSVCEEIEIISYDRSAPAQGHQIEYQLVPRTCTEPMMLNGVCSVCNHVIESEPTKEIEGIATAAMGHTEPEEWTIELEPTCQTAGLRSKHCTVCGDLIVKEEIPVVNCYEQIACVLQNASCIDAINNVSLMTCKWCDEIIRVDVEEFNHTFSAEKTVILLDATCETEGILLKVCDDCGYEVREAIAALGHMSSEPAVVPADCDSCEQVVIYCDTCHEVLRVEAEIDEPLGHAFDVYDPVIGKNVCIYCREVQPD